MRSVVVAEVAVVVMRSVVIAEVAVVAVCSVVMAEVAVVAVCSVVMAEVTIVVRMTTGSVSNMCRTASVAVPIVTAIPTVAHAYMMVARDMWTEVVVPTFVITPAGVIPPTVTAMVRGEEVWATEVEVVAMRIAGVDAEVPVAAIPVQWAVEIGGCTEGIPLPLVEDITQVEVPALPIDAKHIVVTGHSHQVVQVDLVGCLILGIAQVQFVCHLVGQEQGLVACLLV